MTSPINIDAIFIDERNAPAGSHGFRKGTWTAVYEGKRYEFYASVPHSSDGETQRRLLQHAAARRIAKYVTIELAEYSTDVWDAVVAEHREWRP